MRLENAFLLCSALVGCRTGGAASRDDLVPGLATYQRAVTTRSEFAQRWFDQGMTLYWGFDHDEAEHSFARAAEIDPGCAMAYWGEALSAGPNYNNASMDEARSRRAHEALEKARANVDDESPAEQALVTALEKRYAWPPPEDRRALDEAWAAAMKAVSERYPADQDARALYAEALMDLRPWDLWTADGKPQPGTPEIVAAIDAALADQPLHPGANHLEIHAHEASPTPEMALRAADRLRGLVPGAGHLVHMPSHIDIRLGHYQDAILANQRGIEADRERVARWGAGGFYAMYRAHNYHFLVYAAQFAGQSELALATAREMIEMLPPDVVAEMPGVLDAFLATPLHVLERFGRWEELLREPQPEERFPVTTAFWHYSRGLALSALGRVEEAAAEQAEFERALERVPADASAGVNSARVVLDIGRSILAGELEYRRGNFEAAFTHLREAVAKDEALRYDEPWGWFQPAAHALGALLLERGKVEEAEQVYRHDLERHPENGWALVGLEECLRRAGRLDEADAVLARFQKSWARADVEIRSSCFCRVEG